MLENNHLKAVEPANPELVTIVLPSYNEEAAMPKVLPELKAVMDASGYKYEILVVDDGSKDRTAQVSREFGVRVVRHRRNFGVGRARKTGIIHANGEIIVMNDADGTYPADAIPAMLKQLEGCDMVIGARRTEAGTVPLLRTAAKEAIKGLASLITATRIPDLNSGLRAFRRSDSLRFFNILPEGHSWVSTITLAYLSNNYSVEWMPIDYYKRIGRSTFTMFGDTLGYLTLVVRTVTYFNPLRFFLPASAALGGVGLVKVLYDWLILSDIKESDIAIILMCVLVAALGMLADLAVSHNKSRYMKPLSREFTPTLPIEDDKA